MVVLIKDVAKYANTSPSTVSQVLNGRPTTIRVSEATRKRVLKAADVLGYRANPIAQSLRTRRTATIGIVFQGMQDNAQRIEALHLRAGEAGYQLLLAISGAKAERQEHEIRRLMHLKIDGLAILSPSLEEVKQPTLTSLIRQKFPVVGIGPLLVEGADNVDWDRVGVYKAITQHLLQRNCTHFLFYGHADTPGVRMRIEGIRSALSEAGRGELRLVRSDMNARKGIKQHLKGAWAHAVICSTDQLAAQVIQAAGDSGRVIPNDLAVTGCSDLEFSSLLTVPLTTIRMPHVALASTALSRLIDTIAHPENRGEPVHAIVPAEIVIRRSSEYGTS